MNEKIKVLTVQFLKELGRVVVAAVIPVIFAYANVVTPEIAVILFAGIKSFDRSSAKAGILKRGLVQF